ncbi:AMP-binding protein [Nocardia fluminea]|uniref:AMP-binding protein n=1 Tax=Nocardia fluminea TaxID=134984 RepID=UPI00366FD038
MAVVLDAEVRESTHGADAYEGEGLTVLRLLETAVAECGDHPFLDFEGQVYSFRQVEELAGRFAHALSSLGVEPGTSVASLLDTSIDSIVTWFAVNKLGAVWVPLNTAYRGEFLRHQLDDSKALLAVCGADYVENVTAVADGVPGLTMVLVQNYSTAVVPETGLRVLDLDRHRGDRLAANRHIDAADLSMLIYTSGTTGVSKGCKVTHNYMCSQGLQCNEAVPPMPGEVMYTCLPLFHVSALSQIIAALAVRTTLAVSPRFSVSRFWAEIERSGARNALLMGSIFPLLAFAEDSPEMLRCQGQLRVVTGVPVAPEVRAIWKERFGVEHVNSFGYGLTEGARIALHRYRGPSTLPPEDSCGEIASDRFEVVVLDDRDRVLADGSVGEIAFRPKRPHVMFDGYWNRPEDTLAVQRNLWMHTGDLGRIVDNVLYFVDRKKDYLRNRGENISSVELERAFLTHPDIVEAAVHEIGSGVGEDRMKVTVVRVPGSALTELELCRWAIENVPYFAVPRYFEFRDELPRTATSKIMKVRLREEGRTHTTWDREDAGIRVLRPAAGDSGRRGTEVGAR